MKKILVFNDYYIPSVKCGGPVTSIYNAVNALQNEYEFYIEAVNHDFGDKTPFPGIEDKWYEIGPAHVRYHKDGELDFHYKKIEAFIREINPDMMWFSGLLVPNKIHNAIRVGYKLGISVLISPRGEASPERMALKGYKKFPYAALVSLWGIYKKGNVFFHATSDDEIEGLCRYFHVDKNRIFKVPNIGVVATKRKMLYFKESGKLRIMFISRIHEVKNLHYAIQLVNQLKWDVIFDIFGPIESGEYWKLCEKYINESPKNVVINYCGQVNPAEVKNIYSKYDCFLFPTINENYGHVIAEALAYGCPVILSERTTPWDDLNGIAGNVCELGRDADFIRSLDSFAKMDNEQYEQYVNGVSEYYKKKTDGDDAVIGHKKMFDSVIAGFGKNYGK